MAYFIERMLSTEMERSGIEVVHCGLEREPIESEKCEIRRGFSIKRREKQYENR